jgi:hypothetical protein
MTVLFDFNNRKFIQQSYLVLTFELNIDINGATFGELFVRQGNPPELVLDLGCKVSGSIGEF